MDSDSEYRRLCWHSRRGMLELDLVLEPFVKGKYLKLPKEDQLRYQRLLECEDQDLFSWFMGRSRPQDEELVSIVETILEYKAASH
jgi:antitoxin CptB